MDPTTSVLQGSSLVNMVPADVWRSIFEIVVQESIALKTLLGLTHVCSTWRAIATEAPELWTRILVLLNSETTKLRGCPNVEILSLIVRNARSMPITMSLLVDQSRKLSEKEIRLVLEFLRQSFRAQHFTISCWVLNRVREVDELALDLATKVMCGAPHLEELGLDLDCATTNVTTISTLWKLWFSAPLLHSFYLRGPSRIRVTDVEAFHKTRFPFNQLTTLEIECEISVKALFTILSHTTSLIDGEFNAITGAITRQSTPEEPICLPSLQTLDIGCRGLGSQAESSTYPPLTELLGFLKTPALKRLVLREDYEYSDRAFRVFLTNSACKLDELSLDIEGTEEQRIQILGHLPSLEILDMNTFHWKWYADHPDFLLGEAFCDVLREWDDARGQFKICPRLRKIVIDWDALKDPTRTTFSDMVEERWRRLNPKGSTLSRSKFEVVVSETPNDSDCDQRELGELIRLFVLKRCGLALTVEPHHWLEDIICV